MKRPSFLITESNEDYHRVSANGGALSSHLLNTFRTNPQFYKRTMDGEILREETPAMFFGSAVHKLVLEGIEGFNEEYTVSDGPINEKTGEPYGKATKAYREWASTLTSKVITIKDFDTISKIQKAVWQHEQAASILSNGFSEGVIRTVLKKRVIQTRMDWYNPEEGFLADLKTCEDITWFERDARRYGYIHQMAFYRTALQLMDANINAVYLIAVEKCEPFRCGVFAISKALLIKAANENYEAMDRLTECEKSGFWPTGYEAVRVIDINKGE